ncbi:class I SAM-dependent methyltransferase [Methylobacterium oryzisoli]|uniref:class I SAM-dependent methyltransferase n=1 Tax=Methylobacterium oryzisoli TaxID=3385502 RepID=UPI0038916306
MSLATFYARHLGPRLVGCLCAAPDIAAQREAVVPHARGVVLEIGIGPGLNLPYYDPDLVERVIGVDPHAGFLALGEAARRNAVMPVEILQAPAEQLPLAEASIDTAVITYTLCSVDDPARCLAEVRRVLRPDGCLLFLEHGLSAEPAVARWQHRIEPLWRPLAVGCHLTRPTVRLLQEAGFAVAEVVEAYLPRVPRALGFQCRGLAYPA